MEKVELPDGVRVVETGIAGIALVQELQEGWDALIVVDAVDRGRPPGQVMMIEPDVVDVDAMSWEERSDFLSDMHLATPERALTLARALGVLPPSLLMVGCQPQDPNAVSETMSEPVAKAVDLAVVEITRYLDELLAGARSESGA